MDLRFLVEFAEMAQDEVTAKEREITVKLEGISSRRISGLPAQPRIPFDASARYATSRGVRVQRVGRLRVDLPKLQARLAQMLRDIATHTATALTRGANVGVAKTRYVEVKRFFRIAFETVDDCGILRLSATVDQEGDDVLYATLLLLDEVGRDRIALCAAADCAHLVLRHKKRLFCSDNCYMRDYMRRYRDNDYLPPRKRGKAKGASRGKPTRAR